MMDRRRALTIPFSIDNDNLMESPFRIPMTCLSSQCGKVDRQVSWKEFSGCKHRHCDSPLKNGSILFDRNHAAVSKLEMARRRPCVILTDVLKTELGKAYMERIKQRHTSGNQAQVSNTQWESGQCRKEPPVCRDTRPCQRNTRNDKNKNVTPRSNQNTTPQRSRHRRLQNVEKEEKDIEEVDKIAEVVDCGLSVSWEPAKDTRVCDEFSAVNIKDTWMDSEKVVKHGLKRKVKEAEPQCNGTGSPKRHRGSVLRLTGEDGRDGGPVSTQICLEEGEEDVDIESLESSIVQFTVGADDPAEVLLLHSQDDSTQTSPAEPIVLSSDDEATCDVPQHGSPAAHTPLLMEDAAVQGQSPQEAAAEQQEPSNIQDMQVLRVVVEGLPPVADSLIPSVDDSCMRVAFSSVYCGGYTGKSNGDIMITDDNIIIPLKDTSAQVKVMLTFGRKELRRYSVWEQQELEAEELHFKGDEDPSAPAILLLCVSEAAAAAVQWDLLRLCAKQDGTTNTGEVSPFILLTLRDPLEGMEGALLRSLLDIDCLSSLTDEKYIFPNDADEASVLENPLSPVLSLNDSIGLIRRTGLDSHLLSLLGLESTEPELNTEQDGAHCDRDLNNSPLIHLEVDPQTETMLELETATEQDKETQLKPEELEHPLEKEKEEPTPVYTLCHRRTQGSYCVSMCKPDSNWTKYKHQGLAHRLIQFPPPPLKGGITVTMEDLQCLDSGQFLNDVIIDFYLKYLLHKASAAMTERSHIFSSFFYKQLTRRDNASEGSVKDSLSCQRQRRHQRVKTWTRHVDIFKKDFLFVPVNQEAHWYLVVICFPGLDEAKYVAWNGPNTQRGESRSGSGDLLDQEQTNSPNNNTESPLTSPALNHSDSVNADTEKKEESIKPTKPGPVTCTEQTYQKKTVCKRPCILIMDSLKRSLHERVFKLLRDYLESEWEVRRGSTREFSPDQMQSSHCHVPLQDNSSDCGLYLLQYVESFLKDPVVHFDLPLHLQCWFPRQQVRRKRDEIRDLVLNLYRHQNLDGNR